MSGGFFSDVPLPPAAGEGRSKYAKMTRLASLDDGVAKAVLKAIQAPPAVIHEVRARAADMSDGPGLTCRALPPAFRVRVAPLLTRPQAVGYLFRNFRKSFLYDDWRRHTEHDGRPQAVAFTWVGWGMTVLYNTAPPAYDNAVRVVCDVPDGPLYLERLAAWAAAEAGVAIPNSNTEGDHGDGNEDAG